ncbi:MAG: hypothetical protein ACLRWA_08375 [Lachnospira sp.]
MQDFVTEYKELWVITKGTARKADSGYNYKKRHYSCASGTTTMYYVRVNTSELDCSDETMDVEVDCEKINSKSLAAPQNHKKTVLVK